MDIFGAVKGHYAAIKDEAAFDINVIVNDQGRADAVKDMILAIRRYNEANQCMNLLVSLQDHYRSAGENKEDEN